MLLHQPQITLFCDESFERVHNNKTHILGICAGIMIPDVLIPEHILQLSSAFDKYRSYIMPGKKLHIANFPNEVRNSIQTDILNIISNKNIICVYDAINIVRYNKFRAEHFDETTAIKELNSRGVFVENIKSNKPKDDVIYELFYSLVLKGLSYCEARISAPSYSLSIMSDRIDGREIEYEKVLRKIKEPGIESEFTLNDAIDKKKLKRKITIKSDPVPSKGFETNLINVPAHYALAIFSADILANTLLSHLKKKTDNYNVPDAIAGHPVLSKLHFNFNDLSDKYYNNRA